MGLFGGDSEVNQAQGDSLAAINSSGWVVGRGNATGGTLSSTSGARLPWYAWASIGSVVIAFAYYGSKRKKG